MKAKVKNKNELYYENMELQKENLELSEKIKDIDESLSIWQGIGIGKFGIRDLKESPIKMAVIGQIVYTGNLKVSYRGNPLEIPDNHYPLLYFHHMESFLDLQLEEQKFIITYIRKAVGLPLYEYDTNINANFPDEKHYKLHLKDLFNRSMKRLFN